MLPDWEGTVGCIAANRITVEGCKIGCCYREKSDGDWDSGWRFPAGDENGVFQQIKGWKSEQDEEEQAMDILKQCQKWHENDEHQKIVDTLEAIPAGERTPEIDMELARAYNNLADPGEPEGRRLLHRALELMQPHEEELGDTYSWNFRMGYAYFYLDQEGRALPHFEKALEMHPGDDPKYNTRQDIEELIDSCKKGISLPQFSVCFRERTEDWWETFAEMEAELRQMMDEDKDHTRVAEIVAQMEETLNLVFDEISFEMGVGGEKYELILTPEGDKVNLFELVYFQKHAPKEVLEHWNILVGRQPSQNTGLRTDDGWEISGEDVQIWLEELGENRFSISAYCEKLLPMLQEKEGRVWWMLTTLTDQVLGEIPHMRYIDAFDVLEEPKAEPAFLLSQLPDKLKEKGLDLSCDPEGYLEGYLGYKLEANKDPDADWRLDTMVGFTCCAQLVNGYLNADNDYMDQLQADGAAAGFLCYPLDTLREEEGTEKIFDFRDRLEEALTAGDGPEILTLTGGATGIYCGYVDFIAWDIRAVLQKAKEFFESTDIPWASFHTFRREAGTVTLKNPPEGEPEDEDAPAVIQECQEKIQKRRHRAGRKKKVKLVPGAAPFEGFDFTSFWDDNEYALKEYVSDPPSDELIASVEEELGYKLPASYIWLMKRHNGGMPVNTCCPTDESTSWAEDHVAITGILGIGRERAYSLCGELGSQFMIDEWEYPAIGVAICDCPSAGHDMIFLDYRACGPQGEPTVVHVDQENDYKITHLADSFEEFIRGLEPESSFDKDADEETEPSEETDTDRTGVFTGFVLLSRGEWDKEQFIRDMKDKWDITVGEYDAGEEKDDDALVFEVGDMLAAVSLNNYSIPGGEAEANAENNYMWEDAVKAAREHRAHILVAVLGKEENLLEKGRLFTKAAAACCRQKYAAGVYTSGVVFEPRFYEGFADMMKDGELPIFNWIWFGLWRNEKGLNGYTYGMEAFGKDEMEVLGADADPGDLRDFLASLASYVLENDVELHDGETIGFSADDKHAITRSPGVGLPEEQMTLKISWESGGAGPDDDGDDPDDGGDDSPDGEAPQDEEPCSPEVYTEEEMKAVEGHIQQYFGKFKNVFHELVSPDIHVDICVVPPSQERDYYILVTMGMGAHRMHVPEELAAYKLERAELAIALPADWKLDQESMKDEQWYWPIRLLKTLARLPIASDTWLGFGHTMDNEEDFAKGTKLCAALLTGPQGTEEGSQVCVLPGGGEVNFYQVIPLYRDELEYKMAHDAETLLDKMDGISFVVEPDRQDAISRGALDGDDEEDYVVEMDDADWHLETIREKGLPVDERRAYSHMAIYLRWCMEHDLMSEEFLAEYGEVVQKVKADPAGVDLRAFIRDELDGQLAGPMFNKIGRAFASYYYGEPDSPYFPSDIDNYAIGVIGQERNYSDEIQDEAYLFLSFDEDYYQAMAEVIGERFTNWQGQDFDENTLEPSELAEALMEYLNCECTYFPSMKDDDPIIAAYSYARRDAAHEGFVPVLIRADDETLWECLMTNSDPDSDGVDDYAFDPDKVEEYRKKMLAAPLQDGKAVLEELIGQRKAEAEDDDLDWDEEVLGEMEGGDENDRFSSCWDDDTEMTYPLILAKIPVKNPWEIFAYLPFGNWNECPDTPELMAAAKHWFEQYSAAPAAMSHDELEFLLPAPVPREKAMEAAAELYGFCPDIIDQGPEDAAVGALADVLRQSTVWYFWWD